MRSNWIFTILLLLCASASATLVPSVDTQDLIRQADVIVMGTLSEQDRSDTPPARGKVHVTAVMRGSNALLGNQLEVAWSVPSELVRSRANGLWFLTADRERGNYRSAGQTSLPAIVVVASSRLEPSTAVESQVAKILADTIASDDRSICDAANAPSTSKNCAPARRKEALDALLRLPRSEVSEQLLILANHPVPEVSLLATAGLVDLGMSGHVHRVFDLLLHPSESEMIAARQLALAMARSANGIIPAEQFVIMYTSADKYIRRSALDGLRSAATEKELPFLMKLLEDREFSVRFMAANTMLRISGQDRLDEANFRQQENSLKVKLKTWANTRAR
ncbi:HEAT repeat domain-containing protein [Ideonella sp. 4Y16]|uniref:HEAT repeat domain-containing protein n=1 Tax=Ideonella alba TaxID=2824118 RepID=UPI001B386D18|nr:HEAT repeat domain-containing protein [Ideonella alba]MBQ0942944.1 HEAT repeat domain-containing protein [Ideonella alba]